MDKPMKNALSMAQLAKEESRAFDGTGFCAPDREHWGSIERVVRERATRVVNGMLKTVVHAYLQQARPFLVAELISEIFSSIRIEFDDKGPFVRLNTTKTKEESLEEGECGL